MFTRLHLGSLALRPALLLDGNLRPLVTKTPLPHATEVYGQLPGRDFNPLDLLLLLRTVRSKLSALHYGMFQGLPPLFFSENQSNLSPLILVCLNYFLRFKGKLKPTGMGILEKR